MEMNQENSPLLNKLPPEVRNTIFSYAVGGETIHFHRDDQSYGLRHTVCVVPDGDQMAYHTSIMGPRVSPSWYHIESFSRRHFFCMPEPHKRFNILRRPFDISLLLVSHQISAEAMPALWKSNAFSFTDSRTFALFMGKLNAVQKSQLANLHICSEFNGDYHSNWAGVTHQRLLQSLRGLKSFELSLDVEQCRRQAPPVRRGGEEYPAFFLGPFETVQQLQIKEARVMVTDVRYHGGNHKYPDNIWTNPENPLTWMSRVAFDWKRFNWLEKRALACDFETRLEHGSDTSVDITAETKRRLGLEELARVELEASKLQPHTVGEPNEPDQKTKSDDKDDDKVGIL
ncbi:MAG: hypothetical protein Q9218_006487, partial [Villophora microphyllina]